MRKLINIFLAFSLLVTVFTMNTFAEGESDVQDTSESQAEVLDGQSAAESQDSLESIPQDENSGTQGVQDSKNEILSSKLETEFQVLSDSESNNDLASYTVEQIDNGDVVLTFKTTEEAKNVKGVSFREAPKNNKCTGFIFDKNLVYENNTIVVKYSIIKDVMQFKQGSTYRINLMSKLDEAIDTKYQEVTLNQGATPWSIVASIDEDSNLIISSDNDTINAAISNIYIYTSNYVEGYDINALFNFDKVEHKEGCAYVSGDYIRTFKFQQNVDYNVEVDYEILYNDQYVSSSLILNSIQFNYDLLIGPEMVGFVDDGILFIESKDNNESGIAFLNSYWSNNNNYPSEVYAEVYVNSIKCHIGIDKDEIGKYENGLQINLRYDVDLKELDISDEHKLYIRVPGKGLSEITFAINEDSMKLDSATISQDESGNIVIGENSDLDLKSVESIFFVSVNPVEDFNYFETFYDFSFDDSGSILISYSDIKYSLLKGDTDYKISIGYGDGINRTIAESYRLEKGSVNKDISKCKVSQNDDGDILIAVDDYSFLNYELDIILTKREESKYIYFENKSIIKDFENGLLKIPYDSIKKSQLSTGKYKVEFGGNDFFDNFLHFYIKPTIEITKGSTLESLPEYSIEQKDNGDIVILSDSQELIDHINMVEYRKPINLRAGVANYFKEPFIKGDKELIIPYQVVKYSNLEPNSTYNFQIELDDGIFLNYENSVKEVYIKKGSLVLNTPIMPVKYADSVISMDFEDQSYLKNLENGTYFISYQIFGSVNEEKVISKSSLAFDYSKNRVYATIDLEIEDLYMFNLMDGDKCLSYGLFGYYDNNPVYDTDYSQLDVTSLKIDALSYLKELYPDKDLTLDNYQSISLDTSYNVSEQVNDKYFKIYGLSLDNAILMDIGLNITFGAGIFVESIQIPYEYPNKPITLDFTFSLNQMSKLGVTKDNYSSQTVTVLREHNGQVDELAATITPVKIGDTIISFKVTFKTDKMSLFALANSKSIVKPSSGGSGNGGSSATVPVKKPVVNTAAK